MGSDGSNPRRLTNNNDVWDHSPAWSPDGRHIAYTYIGTRSSFSAVGVMESDGSNRRSVAYGNLATWSPDGRQIAYRYGRGIGAVGLDGSNGRSLSRDYGTGPAWSPDGWHIAFRRRKDVYVMGPYGSNPRNLSNLPVPYIGADYTNLVWSPDGRHIAFAARSNGTDEIYVITFHPMTDREALVFVIHKHKPGFNEPKRAWVDEFSQLASS